MICKFCGNEIDDQSQFCFVCGQPVAAQSDEAPLSENEPAAEPQPAAPIPVAEPADAEAYAAVDPRDVQKENKFVRFLCFVCPLIGFIFYAIRTKRGETGKKHAVANAAMSGVCFYLIICILLVIQKSMF